MKHSIYLDQLTLEYWKGKIDPTDCLIIAFIADLNPQNPKLKEHMYRGHFLITRKWLLDQLPMLQISAQSVYKRFRKLKDLGVLSCIHKNVDGNKTLAFFKMSGLYYKISRTRHQKASEEAQKIRAVADGGEGRAIVSEDCANEQSHSLLVSEPCSSETINESIKDSLTTLAPGDGLVPSPAPQVEEELESEIQHHISLLSFYREINDHRKMNKHRVWLEENAPARLDRQDSNVATDSVCAAG